MWSTETLIPYANNPWLHSAADIEKIVASIGKWGWTNPVLVDEQGVLIAGHGRVAAAARLELKSIPVIVAHGWSEEEKQAYRLADNELAARGSWDLDLLRSELGDLKFSGFDLDLIGFEPDRLDEMMRGLGSSGLSDPDTVPDVSDQPVTVPGDIWRSGADNDFMAKALAESGIFVASIDFRMPPAAPHPGSAQDINLGIPWLKANAREFQGRPEWIGSWGTSSGGD